MAKEANRILRNKFTKRALVVLICAAALSVSAVGGVVYAKYIIERNKYATVTSPDFYFESDILTESGGLYYINSMTKSVTVTLKNSADDLRVSAKDVYYTVSVTGGATLNKESGTFAASALSSDTVTVSNLEEGKTYTLEATGYTKNGEEIGFSKTLSISIEVEESSAKVYKYLDVSGGNYVVLTVWTKNLAGDVTVAFPTGLIPDNTNPGMENVQLNARSFTDANKLGVYSSHTYRFFKSNSLSVSAENFTVTLNDGTEVYEATVGTP